MSKPIDKIDSVVIKFAGDSGDGMQLTGGQFTNTAALYGNDLATFPDFPAEIRAPQGTLFGVSGFQLKFSSDEVFNPGDTVDVLVAMNAAALKTNVDLLKDNGTIIVNTAGFDKKNLRLAQYEENPLEDGSLSKFNLYEIDVTKITRRALEGSGLGVRDIDRSKNMFVLGFLYWMYNRPIEHSVKFLESKFKGNSAIAEANVKVLKAGYNYGDTTETFTTRYEVEPAKLKSGTYRNIMGNQALSFGLIAASKKSKLPLFYGGYPITPATEILHELSKHKNFGVKTFQAEDEIASICASIGAAFGGSLAITASSGPGIALKGEAIGLALVLELPLVIVNVQRSGPSTGMPTKTEQADLLQALYGRNGEAPIPVIAPHSPTDCFNAAFEACKVAINHMTPVMLLSDGYIANGSEPWKFPKESELEDIKVSFADESAVANGPFLPYRRDENLSRPWAIPGVKGLEHRIGGLAKDSVTGNVSYDPENNEFMVKLREERIQKIADFIPEQEIDNGPEKGKLLILGWGSTYGSIKTAVKQALDEGYEVSHTQIRYLNPFPKNLETLLKGFEKVIIPEINNGQLVKIIRDKFLIDAKGFNKIQGLPFSAKEINEKIIENSQR
ncbi:MAG: 2-oxoglutarate ferredoxin oxidoreductase subunit alpha [Bacteroidetes bacterium]|nr:MAG: 2-oxoglutarate ferredoxin oxidoreductase subunit alpha [Bacteroidota bacterium]